MAESRIHLAGVPTAPPPLTLYVHLPWCLRKCPYCDFNSHALREALPEAAYIAALERDLEAALPLIWGRPIEAVFFGGGTPSLFSPEGIDAILTRVRTLTRLNPLAEISLEANPGTVEAGRFRGYREAGVNRLSLGVQSFDDAKLQALGRIHGAAEARAAAELALTLFDNVNLDLMYGLPGQTLAEAVREIDLAIALGPTHISAYHLTLEPNTPFAANPPKLPDADLAADMQVAIEDRLGAAGFDHYETSAFARPGQRCRHNLNYWLFGDYLGLGAGAHSKLTLAEGVTRQARVRHPRDYLAHAGTNEALAEQRCVRRQDLPFEFMMNALRLTEGFAEALFSARTGLPLSAAAAGIERGQSLGLLRRENGRIWPSPRGQRFLNVLLEGFLP